MESTTVRAGFAVQYLAEEILGDGLAMMHAIFRRFVNKAMHKTWLGSVLFEFGLEDLQACLVITICSNPFAHTRSDKI
jgi:hypothetical protein